CARYQNKSKGEQQHCLIEIKQQKGISGTKWKSGNESSPQVMKGGVETLELVGVDVTYEWTLGYSDC
ncbi:UNVERIFIED_CONTAM: hypothetical protein K2H54_063549, partial [Gekko kuhli]